MAPQHSAGILLYRRTPGLEVWIEHMGGPFWARRDAAAWSIPKGLYEPDEDPLTAALREFAEEIGTSAPAVDYEPLGEFRYSSGKLLTVFAAETDFAIDVLTSNTFPLEWPPNSGRMQDFPEVDDARWFPLDIARQKLVKGQLPVLDALARRAGD
jgi:predicted NUDIX family NTP pyrophosphohydrolase